MATNPQFPENRGTRHDGRMTLVKEGTHGRSWGPIAIIVVAAAILAAIIVLAPHAPKKRVPPTGADVPAQRTGSQLQVSDINISNMVQNGPATIRGMLFNNGDTAINAVQAVAIFKAKDGTNLPPVSAPLMGVRQDGSTQPFADDPIKPNERRAFQMEVAQLPKEWNGSLPELQFPTVTGEAPNGKSASSASSRQ